MNSILEIVETLLLSKKIDGFLGYRVINGHPLPYLFRSENIAELPNLVTDEKLPRYPLTKILVEITKAHPQVRIGVIFKDCEQRALNELIKLNQINPERILIIPQNCCPSFLKEEGTCSYLQPSAAAEERALSAQIFADDACLDERFQYWQREFQKCLKCYGCRNVCPLYVCKECSLEDEDLIPKGMIPPDISFHLIRAIHMAGFCIDCGLCAEACPAQIPLRQFYRGPNQIMEKLFNFQPGKIEDKSPLQFTGLLEERKNNEL
ncbi:MAG: 4Fe-4S binding protein [Thermodesulfobacteriota bacterium]